METRRHRRRLAAAEPRHHRRLQGLGGEREAADIFSSLREAGGDTYDDYDYAFIESTDRFSGEHVVIMSRYPIFDARRLNEGVKRHVAADITLPGGQNITVVTLSMGRGTNSSAVSRRRKGAATLRRTVARTAKKQPVLVMGDIGSSFIPDDDGYRESTAGVLAGAGGRSDDDCQDSAEFYAARNTHLDGRTLDHVFSCGLEMVAATTSGREQVVNGDEDPEDKDWVQLPLTPGKDGEPATTERDASRHLVVRAELKLPEGKKRTDAPEASDEN